ncbi:ORF6C domain-containing protein [Clostridium thermobutyricum]|uniref:ORF6C domain protein n=1 Tax=Clostridium thermobutyricum DSM 4928 TaxID=1121339 RepID=A0A1V4SWD9_9CLOT|nr:ORF6C domain-containing protein [Clostridium thermobutyricum]OPX47927.1 ORF6C domain protein [Clostridium thermobutyricum DSM 4928]
MNNNLINVKVNEEGNQIVSAKELYLGLGLRKKNWSRWYPINIQNNDFFKENIDWLGVPHKEEGNETMDFAITLEFAKHIAMMARTNKSHEYRNYFIECENKLKSGQAIQPQSSLDLLELQVKALKEVKGEVQEVRNDFEEFKGELPLLGSEPEELQAVVKAVGTKALGGYGCPAYKDKSLSARVFKNVWKYIKDQFNVKKYKAIKRKNLSKAIELAYTYEAPFYLQEEIDLANKQIKFKSLD